MTALTLEHIYHAYGDLVAVDDLSLRVEPGEIVCLLGPSGCGKTTTLRLAAGLERLQRGRIIVGNDVVSDETVSKPPEARNVGMVFQDYALFPHLTVDENVKFGLPALGRRGGAPAVSELLERVGLSGFGSKYPHMLSGGEQQRVALARALAPRPGVMLLDEPFANLDVRLRDQVRDDCLKILGQARTATLLVTHDPDEAMRMADRIAVMRNGRIVQVATPTELYHQPLNGFIVKFTSRVNVLRGVSKAGRVATPLGEFAADGLAEATPVEILVRPEGVCLMPNGANTATAPIAEVFDAKLLGPYALVRLGLPRGDEIIARVHDELPKKGASVKLQVDPEQVFVFPVTI